MRKLPAIREVVVGGRDVLEHDRQGGFRDHELQQ
jgi:hypothetical protein